MYDQNDQPKNNKRVPTFKNIHKNQELSAIPKNCAYMSVFENLIKYANVFYELDDNEIFPKANIICLTNNDITCLLIITYLL